MINIIKKPLLKILFLKRQLNQWYVNKYIIPPYDEKRTILRQYKNDFNLKTFIETGTFLGDTIKAFKNDFNVLYSIELSKELAEKATKKFSADPHIHIIQGDSGEKIDEILNGITEPVLFWLDGHYSSEFFLGDEFIQTAKGQKDTPIIEELKTILNHHLKNHVILIDDARCFRRIGDYPTIDELKKLVTSINSSLQVSVKRDIIRIVPTV